MPVALRCLLATVLAVLAGCGSFEQKRIREMMNEKGFGSRAQGAATKENYVGGRDRVQFLIAPEAYVGMQDAARLPLLGVPQPVEIDGTIFIPYVGPVYVLGKTEAELTRLVKDLLRPQFKYEIDLQARIVGTQKYFFAVGETVLKGPVQLDTDMTLIDAVFKAGWTNLANLGRVYVIQPDAENPLVIDVNFREMLLSGYTAYNLPMHEYDVLYLPPTFIGLIARLLERLLEPVNLAVRAMLGLAYVQDAYNVLQGDQSQLGFFRF